MKEPVRTRREFLKRAAATSSAAALYLGAPHAAETAGAKSAKVVLVRNKNLLDSKKQPKAEIIQKMLDDAIVALTSEKTAAAAFKKFFKPADIVGIKSNEWRHLPTPRPLEEALKKRVMDAGVAEKNISIDDRGVRRNKVFKKATALINARPLRTHHWSGVGTLLKNYIMFVDSPSSYHPDTCADLGAMWKLPQIAGKTRLNILVCFTPLFNGSGPHHFNPKYTWEYNGMLVGTDAVAVDSVGVRLLQAKRREYFGENRPIAPPPKHVALADTRHSIGVADAAKIELVKLGWKDSILI